VSHDGAQEVRKSAINRGVSQAETAASPRHLDGSGGRRVPWPVVKGSAKVMAIVLVAYFVVPGLVVNFNKAVHELANVNPALLAVGLGLQAAALLAYSVLTRAALPKGSLSLGRLFRIQLSTKALSNIVPAGSAAGNALGYRLLTASGVAGPDAGFALATVGLGSAVVLNVLLLVALVVSIPARGVNPLYGIGAAAGVVLIGIAVLLVIGLLRGQRNSEHRVRAIAQRLKFDPDRAVEVIRHMASRVRELLQNKRLLGRVTFWAVANWALDMTSLWVFIRAFGETPPIDGLIIAFGLANVLAVIPLTPGGVGVIEATLVSALVPFGLTKSSATLGVVGYRGAQYWLPMLVGGICYLSLKVGAGSIDKREGFKGLRQAAGDGVRDDTSGIEWVEKYGRRDTTGPTSRPRAGVPGEVLHPRE
jgi:putative heme transporter